MLEAAEGPAPLLPLALLEKPNPTQPESDAPPKLILLDSALAALSAAARAAAKGSVIFAGRGLSAHTLPRSFCASTGFARGALRRISDTAENT